MKLDHIMFAVNDLEAGIREVEALLGAKAEFGGAHPGGGTCNALLSFGDKQYLEIIAPDDNQSLTGTLGEELKNRSHADIRTWAAAVDDNAIIEKAAADHGYTTSTIDMSRTRPDGVKLEWQIIFVTGHPFGLEMPFFINWLESPHPADDAPMSGRLRSFEITSPEAAALGDFFCSDRS